MHVAYLIAILACVAGANALYSQCQGVKKLENFEELVKVSGCKKTFCRLRKKTQSTIEIKLKPDKEIKKLTNTVWANIAGIPFPFIGVDGSNACSNIFTEDGKTKATCPLQAGTTYTYRNVIDILEIYPTVKVIVHWALSGPDGDLACFEVPARITN